MPFAPLGISFALSLILIPVVRRAGLRLGLVSQPRHDRWHRGVIPLLGGVGVFGAFAAAILLTQPEIIRTHGGLLAGAAIMFLVGLYDDVRPLSPPVKFTAQILAAAVVVFSGYRTGFFDSELPNILITIIWLVGITNAINLLDNMDGLAGGISLIAASFLAYFFRLNAAEQPLLVIALSLAGGLLGFLIFNFPPAKIFMGDNGSLFFGFTLASLAIARTPQASNVFAVMSVPTLLFILPILDTAFVTFTRLLRGQSPAQGGRDHTSHRLVAFGLSERQTVLVLYGLAIISGVAGALIESVDYTLSLVLIPVLVVTFALLAAYLSRLKVVDSPPAEGAFATFLSQLTYRRRLLEIALDFFLISIAYYLAWWTRHGFLLAPAAINGLVQTLPVALACAYTAFFLLGIYQGVWRYTGFTDIFRFARGVFVAAGFFSLAVWLLLPAQFSLGASFLFAVFLFFALTASRSSFKLLDQLFRRQAPAAADSQNVVIYDAGDAGELTLRWVEQNPQLGYRVVGFLDDDPLAWGRTIHGIEVLGGPLGIASISRGAAIHGVILVPGKESVPHFAPLAAFCQQHGIWLRVVRIQFELIETR